MKIQQARISGAIGFKPILVKKYGFSEYLDPKKPAFFFGCYGHIDLEYIQKHKAFGVVVWRGTDATRMGGKAWRQVREAENLKHIAISNFIAKDLSACGLKYVLLPVSATDLDFFKPCPLGEKVYVYGVNHKTNVYNKKLVKDVQLVLRDEAPDIEFVYGHYYLDPDKQKRYPNSCHPKNEMPNIYAKCFTCLRLTTHDGLSNTVLEMGLMGRKCIWNGGSPNAIPWRGVEDIVESVLREREFVGKERNDIAASVKQYLTIGDDWMDTSYYDSI